MNWLASAPHWCAPVLASTFALTAALWLGTVFSASWLSGCAAMMADGPEIARLALTLFRRWAVPSLWVSLLAGAGWLALSPLGRTRGLVAYVVAGLAVSLIGVHVAIGARAKKLVRGSIGAARGERILRFALLVLLGALIALASHPAMVVR